MNWIFARRLCRQAGPGQPDIDCKLTAVDALTLARELPGLGRVLLVSRRDEVAPRDDPSLRLVADAASMALLETRWLLHACLVSTYGPLEWFQCLDGAGRVLARLHLLPETDFVAWDRLLAGDGDASPRCHPSQLQPLAASRAQVVRFRTRKLAGLTILEQREAWLDCAAMSRDVASRLARSEALELAHEGIE